MESDAARAMPWLIAAVLLLSGGISFRRARRLLVQTWGEVHAEIVEEAIGRAEA